MWPTEDVEHAPHGRSNNGGGGVSNEHSTLLSSAPSSSSKRSQQQSTEELTMGGYSAWDLSRALLLMTSALLLSVFAFSGVKSGFDSSTSSENGGFDVFKITSFEDIPRDALFANFSSPAQQKLFAMFVEKYALGVSKENYGSMFSQFKMNLDKIDTRNAQEAERGGSARHGINKYTGSTDEELARLRGGKKPTTESLNIRGLAKTATVADYSGTSTSADWSGIYTTAVRDQGYCGGCWAFSAVSQMESDAIRTGLLTTDDVLSPQQLISCSEDNDGCGGGWTEFAFSYAMDNGIELETDFPYTSYDEDVEKCSVKSSLGLVQVDAFYVITSEDSMIDYVLETGPLSVCVDSSDWDSYMDGIVSSCGNNVDHCVQLVGVDLGEGSWKIRNTWGEDWGEDGYIRLQTNQNMCGITDDPIYTQVSLLRTISTTSAPTWKPTHAPSPSAELPEKPTTTTAGTPTLYPTAGNPTLYPTIQVENENGVPTLYPTVAAPTLFPTATEPTTHDATILPTTSTKSSSTSKPSHWPTLLPTMPPSLPAILPAAQSSDTSSTEKKSTSKKSSKESSKSSTTSKKTEKKESSKKDARGKANPKGK